MVRIFGILAGLGFVGVAAWSLLWGAVAFLSERPQETVEHRFHEHAHAPAGGFSFDGPFGRYDRQQLQRGMQVYQEVCSSCHSLQYVAFRDFHELGYSEAEVHAIADRWPRKVPIVNAEGSPGERNPVPADRIPSPYPNETAARVANGNALPPDLSLITKAREGGAAYVYSLLTGYHEPPRDLPRENRPTGTLHYNPYFANLNIAMPPPLRSDGQVTYGPGNPPATRDQMAQDVAAFLAWTAEPKADGRKNMGFVVMIFLLIATILAYMAYQNIWHGGASRRVRRIGALDPENMAKREHAKGEAGIEG